MNDIINGLLDSYRKAKEHAESLHPFKDAEAQKEAFRVQDSYARVLADNVGYYIQWQAKDKAQAEKLIAKACALDSKSWDNLFQTVLDSSTPALVQALETMVILNSEYPIENLKSAIFSARREGLDAKTVKSYEMDVWRAEQKLIAVEAVQNEEPEPDEEEIQDAKNALAKSYAILRGSIRD